ncbi:tyrosine-type recombinase/integrase [Aurantimonas marianensis]|uniref:Site-specific integrase n=1 Tax=Aurantimonas marianensis TaxID=2920428 RepID=A0A9X2KFX7_9HYPH|nr:site-specific integrase [Aurantimonas marianensis]MCP3055856.1 site-specific integrase [Aurantimonas marianensis]
MAPKSVDQALAAIAGFEASTGWRDFARFHIERARKFKRQLEEDVNPKTGRPLAKATSYARLKAVGRFIHWLAGQQGYKSKISYSDADYFNPSANDARIATASREQRAPSVEQVRHVIASMPAGSDIEKRDRALIAFILLTGARDDAVASLSLKHVDMDRRLLDQDARTVRTKNRKTFPTWFFPIGDDIEAIVRDWKAYLGEALLFGPDDPLFPKTKIGLNEGQFAPAGLERAHWSNADPIRRVFRESFEGAGLPYFNPHSLRKTLARLGERVCGSPEEFKAWSQNLGHDQVMTTLVSYGTVAPHRQEELIGKMRIGRQANSVETGSPDPETVRRVLEHLVQGGGLGQIRD